MFFDQIKDIDGNIKDLRDHLKNIGVAVDDHFDQLDDIAAHIIALEALMVQLVRKLDLDTDAAKVWIRENTETSTGKDGGSEKAPMVIDQMMQN
ncbi:MAG: hypothetical protein HOO19_02865 [Rhodospirillaceae bacterium]|jgi:hypothetical protein|nr:hypothetical protein [Rhodospirillaceae bacterium]MBT3883452.1 hypothetical protein [Rhodospirillaceae bacterium]MBT4114812.1 hypothetical protein [Rhodospirillaceae bacterium]MBT4674072.1 hypothetical protein [Rhodospirillaceae bacterium]MBT4719054.1 hypothetical protein [Rhodospirillaceae bacterium]